MPIYEYECAKCGEFEMLRPMSEAAAAMLCPDCCAPAQRIMSMPRINTMNPLTRMATERNERSRVEPKVRSTGCRHNHNRAKPAAKSPQRTRHRYTGLRPWVIEHR